ncbi:MAG: sigma-70 family RNA polymerase sigma factor [Halioglobus sp.]
MAEITGRSLGGRCWVKMPQINEQLYAADEARWASLMVAAQKGEQEPYRQLLAEVGEAVSRYLTVRFGAHAMIEDCVQDVLMAMHEGRHTYNPSKKFRPWLFTIARHKAIDALRKRNARREVPEEEVAGVYSEDVTEGIDRGKLLARLSTTYCEAVTLTKLVGLSNAEAAARLQISESAVKVRVHRGMLQLRQFLEAEQI